MNHGERIASLETRVLKIEEVQGTMVVRLEKAADGLRSLATQIDSIIKAANGQEVRDEPLSTSFNKAWKHFQSNFALFIIYGGMGLFMWAMVKSFLFKEVPPLLKQFIR